ncbi:glutathione S-transferase family protein [Trinickia dinghuensis]|uniref:Glutathione S-transferase n=1 Tax=Trinickia dinghuensis TaxID=2291023 RepID=A0A3D8JUD3_9BURK|nr:glutathione S-transferase [Trinickia dinghuensis]RDU96510.1 glutathione S-transferase [Trinickia dinghuensis]
MNREYKLHCFAQSGNAYKVALMLSCAGADWEPDFVDYFGGVTRTAQWRQDVNEMGEVPVLEHAGRTLSQSGVILDYLADRLDEFGARSDDEKREILRWMLFDNHKFTSYLATYRWLNAFASPPPHAEVLAFFRGRAEAAFAVVDRHLAEREFMVANRPTIADFSMAGYVFYPTEETGFDFSATHPNIARWKDRIAALPGWRQPYDLMPGQRIAPRNA